MSNESHYASEFPLPPRPTVVHLCLVPTPRAYSKGALRWRAEYTRSDCTEAEVLDSKTTPIDLVATRSIRRYPDSSDFSEGDYVVVIAGTRSGGMVSTSVVHPPARVVHSLVELGEVENETYWLLQPGHSSEQRTSGDLRRATYPGFSLTYPYVDNATIDSILGMWPDVQYDQHD